jgi:hypothetical protein
VTIRTYPNQKSWENGSIRAKPKSQTSVFNHGKVTGDMDMYKQTGYDLRKAINEAKRQYMEKVESQFKGSDKRRMC